MDVWIAALVIASAFIHPLRDVFIKGIRFPESAYLGVVFLFTLLAVIHTWLIGADPLAAAGAWPLVLLSAFGLFLYYIGVQATMRTGHLSVYYPIIRSSPLFIVVIGFVFLDHRYSVGLLCGVALTMVGAFFLQYRRGTSLLNEPRTFMTALLAMSGHGITSLADAKAMQSMEPAVLMMWVNAVLILACGTYFAINKPTVRSIGTHLVAGWRTTPVRIVAAGVLSYLSYLLILIAFQRGGDVAAVSSLRQISILMSVLLGGALLSETNVARNLLWSMVLGTGVVVIILSR